MLKRSTTNNVTNHHHQQQHVQQQQQQQQQQQAPPLHSSNTTTTMTTGQQPPGWNKNRRDICKGLLLLTTLFLLGHQPWGATVTSAASVFCIKEGTVWSTKNLKWMMLSGVSFGTSLISIILQRGYEGVDEEKAYGLSFCMWFMSKSLQTFWGCILGMFLGSAFTSPQAAVSAAAASTTTTTTSTVYPRATATVY
mmetsp:Transcript_23059/g.27756  ORF Transcript_23059/g.27756 Transcript_23059/m.27756 type:complete len:195 (+) Transcript_23059:78-662(+)